jgi:hypothetical protein
LREEHGVRVSENMVLRKIFGYEGQDNWGLEEVAKGFINSTPHQILFG